MTRLVLVNGAPGTGKSTKAQALALAQDRSMTLALNVSGLQH